LKMYGKTAYSTLVGGQKRQYQIVNERFGKLF